MIIVAGFLLVDPEVRERYLVDRVGVMRDARAANGCLDFQLAADPLEPGRVNVFERWESAAAVDAFRGSGPSDEQQDAVVDAQVSQYDVNVITALT